VITTVRDEPYLARTVESVLRACDSDRPEILVVEDGEQTLPRPPLDGVRFHRPWQEARGCMAARDWGLLHATHDACVVVDAHMDFDDGLFGVFLDRLRREPDAVLCARCRGLDPETWLPRGRDGHGAWVVWRGGRTPAVPLALSWRHDTGDGDEVSAVLGACYGLSRRRYELGLRRPWRFGTGWGTDEELLSIANWLCGGANRVLPVGVRHWFRSSGPPHPDGSAVGFVVRWANRLRLLRLLPMPGEWRRELESIAYEHADVRRASPYVELQLAEQDLAAYRDFLAARPRSFPEWRERWCLDEDPGAETGDRISAAT